MMGVKRCRGRGSRQTAAGDGRHGEQRLATALSRSIIHRHTVRDGRRQLIGFAKYGSNSMVSLITAKEDAMTFIEMNIDPHFIWMKN
ncbi:hypothetical protein BS78_09G152900 [Paspalum vaginatum]|nr:hypothetical protein BS78_09G152900 [Paspalum vaginatum]